MNKSDLFSPSHLLSSCFFIGYFPLMPGTVASFVAMLTLYFLPFDSHSIVYIIGLNILFIIGAIVSEQTSNVTKIIDASSIVIDEWVGMWIALFFVPKNIWAYLIAFIIFRFFDIKKPFPISYIDAKFPGGLGVMLDDAVAGFFTSIIMQLGTVIYVGVMIYLNPVGGNLI